MKAMQGCIDLRTDKPQRQANVEHIPHSKKNLKRTKTQRKSPEKSLEGSPKKVQKTEEKPVEKVEAVMEVD